LSATITWYGFTGATASGAWTNIGGAAGFVALKAVGTAGDFNSNLIVPAGNKATFNADWYIDATADTRITDRINGTWATGAGVANRAFKINYDNTTGGSFTGITFTVWQNNNETGRTGIVAYDQTNNQFQAARVGSQAASGGTYTIGSAWSWSRVGAGTTITLAQGVAGAAGLNDGQSAVVNFRIKYNSSSQAGDDVSVYLTTRYSWT
jgi:hypothetical protein